MITVPIRAFCAPGLFKRLWGTGRAARGPCGPAPSRHLGPTSGPGTLAPRGWVAARAPSRRSGGCGTNQLGDRPSQMQGEEGVRAAAAHVGVPRGIETCGTARLTHNAADERRTTGGALPHDAVGGSRTAHHARDRVPSTNRPRRSRLIVHRSLPEYRNGTAETKPEGSDRGTSEATG